MDFNNTSTGINGSFVQRPKWCIWRRFFLFLKLHLALDHSSQFVILNGLDLIIIVSIFGHLLAAYETVLGQLFLYRLGKRDVFGHDKEQVCDSEESLVLRDFSKRSHKSVTPTKSWVFLQSDVIKPSVDRGWITQKRDGEEWSNETMFQETLTFVLTLM